MKTINNISQWNEIQDYRWVDYFRFFLGAFLFYVGMNFENNPHDINQLVIESGFSSYLSLVQYLPIINIIGGIMIAFGFQTRWAAAFQIPILAGAVVLYLMTGGQSSIFYSKLAVSIITLGMLVGFLITGSGPYSIDGYLSQRNTVVHSNKYNQLSHS